MRTLGQTLEGFAHREERESRERERERCGFNGYIKEKGKATISKV